LAIDESLRTNKRSIIQNEYIHHIAILIFTNQQISSKRDDLSLTENIFLMIRYYKKEPEN